MITALLISDGLKRLHPASLNEPSLRQEFNPDAAQGLPVQNNPSRDGRRSLFFAAGLRLSLGVLSQARDEHQ
jgi:hypothetical protein